MTPEKVSRNFTRCSNWQERYLYLIELGERFATLPAELQLDSKRVSGCQSQVWLDMALNDAGNMQLNANSDAAIVKGLLALVIIAYDQQPPDEIVGFNIQAWFDELGLQQHLSPTRTQGLWSIVQRAQAIANEIRTNA
uniref:SufE family protein n=1 Tax=Thaumasiovibrio occultus TaxID=1891184 RepID=UPI000B354190|nr:SufE family protein [Thaumasiovibrio occultus]